MSCYKKKEVEEMRDRLNEKVIKAREQGLPIITLSLERASSAAEMLDEYASGNRCEVENV